MKKIFSAFLFSFGLITAADAQDPYVTAPGNYGQAYMSYSLSDNILYAGTSRFGITSSVQSTNAPLLVNGKYDETAITVNAGQYTNIVIDFSAKDGGYVSDCDGYIYLNFFDTFYPDSITATVYNTTGTSTGLDADDWTNVSATSPYKVFRAHVPDWLQGLQRIELRIKSRAGTATKISEIEYIQANTGQYEKGLLTKFGPNTVWYDLSFKDASNTQKAFIKNTGEGYLQKLGIGTNSVNDSTKLAVDGIIRARKVKVDLDVWPDYVFETGYKLPSLQQWETYIKAHHHLPGVVSATEVKENGVELGTVTASLLQKIEELTLLLIQQQKQIDALQQAQRIARP